MRLGLGLYLALFVMAPGAALAQAADTAAAFGARESIEDISLSPDGRRIAYLAPQQGQGSRLFTVDLTTGESTQATAVDGRSQRLGDCSWVSGTRLVCSVFALRRVQGDVGGASRFVALDADGSNIVSLADRNPETGTGAGLVRVLSWTTDAPDTILMESYVRGGLGVVRINTRSNAVEIVQRGLPRVQSYLADDAGRIRLHSVQRIRGETQMAAEEVEYRFRLQGADDWQSLGLHNFVTRDGLRPLAIDTQANTAYALHKLHGRTALYRVTLDGRAGRELLVAHDQVDVDGLLRLGASQRVVGATYATDRRQAQYFDPELRRLSEQLSRAMPGLPLIRFVGASADESILLIWAGSDRDPGRYFTYTKASRALNEIMIARPQLEGVTLAEVRAIQFPAADGTTIPGYLTLPPGHDGRPIPALVMPHGGPAARDEWGFDWLAQYFANRGYAVLQPNFRGSAGYGDAWFQTNGFQSWRTAIGDVNDAGRWLVREGIADPAKLAIVGWSYGGYAALQSAVVEPDLYRAVIAIAPVTDLNRLREESRGWTSFRLMQDFIGSGPHVRAGSPADHAEAIRVPVLMFHGDHDANVGIEHARHMERQLRGAGRPAELVTFAGLDHQLNDSAARTDMLRRSDAFLRSALGIP